MFRSHIQKLEYRSDIDFSNISTILLIDKSVKNYKLFVDSVNSSTLAIVYSPGSSKEELLALLKEKFTSISRIGICFASSLSTEYAKQFLDRKPLFLNNDESPFSENVLFLINVIKKFSVENIDFLACNTLNYSNWKNYYNILQQNTGVIVGASNDQTGNIKYGGDWVMESTNQDIEVVYFTKSIEYYTYLLDVDYNWSSGYYNAEYAILGCDDNYIYVPNAFSNTITKTNLTDGTFNQYIAGFNYLKGVAISGDYLYVCNGENSSISQISLSNGMINNLHWVSGLASPEGIVIKGNDMYVTNFNSGNISKIDMSTTLPIVIHDWATGFNGPVGITIENNDMYVVNYNNGNISKIDISTSSPTVITNWASGFYNPKGIVVNNGYIYVTNANGNISKIDVLNPTNIVTNWATGFSNPYGLLINSGYMYVSNIDSGNVSQIDMLDPDPANIVYIWVGNVGIPTGIISEADYIYVSNGGGGGGYLSTINFTTLAFNYIWSIAINTPQCVAFSGNYMYVTNFIQNGYVSQINLLDNTVSNLFWLNMAFPLTVNVNNNDMYVTNVIENKWFITKVNATTGDIVNNKWVELGDFSQSYDPNKPTPFGIVISEDYMYVSLSTRIVQIYIPNASILNNSWWSSQVLYCSDIAIRGKYMYVTIFNEGYISEVNMSNGQVNNQYWTTGFSGPTGITINKNIMYVYNYFDGTISKIFPIVCFLEGTKILTKEGYKKIEELKKCDLVKTLSSGYKKIDMIGKKIIYNPASEERIKDQLYVYPKNKMEEVFEDLVLTGCHSVLIDRFETSEKREKVRSFLGGIYITEKKARLPACLDERAEIYKSEGFHTIYHVALENEVYTNSYGIYANGLLVESCSQEYLKELSGMMLKE